MTRRNLDESLLLGEKNEGDDDEAAMIVAEELKASMALRHRINRMAVPSTPGVLDLFASVLDFIPDIVNDPVLQMGRFWPAFKLGPY